MPKRKIIEQEYKVYEYEYVPNYELEIEDPFKKTARFNLSKNSVKEIEIEGKGRKLPKVRKKPRTRRIIDPLEFKKAKK